jgi:hypothetical protein
MSPLADSPTRPRWREIPISRAFFFASRFPKQSYRKDRFSISGALLPLFLAVPCKKYPLPRFLNGDPMERDIRLQNFLQPILLKVLLSLRVLVREPTPCTLTVSLWREIFRFQNQCFIYSFMPARVPQKESSYKMGEIIMPPSTEPHVEGRSTYNGVRSGYQGDG